MSGSLCIDDVGVNEDLLLNFEVINHTDRKFTYDGISYDSGIDSLSNVDDEPWTYKSRGAWFDGNDLLHLDGEFYLFA